MRTIFTSEAVTEGHPDNDKVRVLIADSILDAHLTQHPDARVVCEVFCKHDRVVLAGEISSRATVDGEGWPAKRSGGSAASTRPSYPSAGRVRVISPSGGCKECPFKSKWWAWG